MVAKEAKNLCGKGESRTLLQSYGMLTFWKDLNKVKLKRIEKYTKLERKYNIIQKGEKVVIEEGQTAG